MLKTVYIFNEFFSTHNLRIQTENGRIFVTNCSHFEKSVRFADESTQLTDSPCFVKLEKTSERRTEYGLREIM